MAKLTYPVEQGIPVQWQRKDGYARGTNNRAYPLKELTVGDSFFVPVTDFGEDDPYPIKCLDNSTRHYARKHAPGTRFVVRTRRLAEHGEEGIRVWRVK